MRINILAWYIKNVIPAIQTLPDDEKTHSSLTLLEDALILLTELEYNLLSGKCSVLSAMLAELKRQESDNSEHHDSEIPDAEKGQLLAGVYPRQLTQMIAQNKSIILW